MLNSIQFTLPEFLSLLGITQCLFILVFFIFRAGSLLRASLPFVYFLVLALAFTVDFVAPILSNFTNMVFLYQIGFWMLGPPLSVLLIVQIVKITELPKPRQFFILLLPCMAFTLSLSLNGFNIECENLEACKKFTDLFVTFSLLSGAVCLLTIWSNRGMLSQLSAQQNGKERYWLILSVIIMNIALLLSFFGYFSSNISDNDLKMVRTILGVALVYLVTTSLFRIYPQSIREVVQNAQSKVLSDAELNVAFEIERLLEFDKVYQEPGYGRAELARELEIPESLLSKIVNSHFDKTLPQLLNEKRIHEAKVLLSQTDISINILYDDVGFKSLSSFNRVFKDITGKSPSEFRKGGRV